MKKIWNILENSQRKQFFLLSFLMIVNMVLEVFAVGMVVPLITILSEENLHGAPYLKNLEFLTKNFTEEKLILFIIFLFSAVILLKSIFTTFFSWYEGRFIYRTQEKISFRIFNTFLRKEYLFHMFNNTSVLITKTKNEVGIFSLTILSLVTLLTEIIVIGGLIILLILYNPNIFFQISFFILLAILVFKLLLSNRVKKLGDSRQKTELKRLRYLTENYNGIRELKVFGITNIASKNYETLSKKISGIFINWHLVQRLPKILLELIGVFCIVTIILVFLNKHNLSETKLILPIIGLYAAAAFRLLPSLNRIIQALQTIKFGKKGVDAVFNVLCVDKQNENLKNDLINFDKSIKISNVSFYYHDENKLILQDLNLEIKKKQKIFIYGETGSGKSTLLNLILGLISPSSGKILIDDFELNLNNIVKNNLIGYVPQQTHLFDESIIYNVTLEHDLNKIDSKKFENCLEVSQISEFFSHLNEKNENIIGEKGNKLSGGERQRLGLARALYRDPEIIILDEATNALDKETEKLFYSALMQNYTNKTVIVVSHNKNLTKEQFFDKIFKVENKKIIIEETN